ncbi:MAG: hypothetical protein JO076_03220 [Verrucomicrobia bacterium]|nr:hypothetical protein [Verrucomicrobiota bacterium]
MVRWLITLFFVFIRVSSTWADGGAVLAMADSGPFRLTVFSDPPVLRAGPVDISVLVQDRLTANPVLDAQVSIDLIPLNTSSTSLRWAPPYCTVPTLSQLIGMKANRSHGQNHLLYGILTVLPHSGSWTINVRAQTGAATNVEAAAGSVTRNIEVQAPLPPLIAYWKLFVLPVAVVVAFAFNQIIKSNARHRFSLSSGHS